MQYNDKNGIRIDELDPVFVSDPSDGDTHPHSFTGDVTELLPNGNIIVVDEENDRQEYEVNPQKTEIIFW